MSFYLCACVCVYVCVRIQRRLCLFYSSCAHARSEARARKLYENAHKDASKRIKRGGGGGREKKRKNKIATVDPRRLVRLL